MGILGKEFRTHQHSIKSEKMRRSRERCGTDNLYDKNEKLPTAGEWSIVLNSKEEPVCVIQDKVVEIVPYNLISKEYAYHEGEGDRSYEYWRRAHDDFFDWEYREAGKVFYLQAPMVCEVFEKVE